MHRGHAFSEVELTDAVELCTPTGTLNRAAVGWSRRPLHRCNLRGRWGRKKRWDYWAVTSQECLFSLTFADLDYLGLYVAQLLDWQSKRLVELPLFLPFAPGLHQLTFRPFYDRQNRIDLGVASTEIHQLFGHFSGTIIDDGGGALRIRDLLGWAEEHRARW